MPYQLLASALVVDIALAILCVVEIDVTIHILRVVTVFIVTVVISEPSIINTLY